MNDSYLSAVNRRYISPVARLILKKVVSQNDTIIDYGSGYGNDKKYYDLGGHSTTNYDPYYFPEYPKNKADIVVLSYVLNVIPKMEEKQEVIKNAWELSKKALVIAVCPGNNARERITERYFEFLSQTKARAIAEVTLETKTIGIDTDKFIIWRNDDYREVLDREEVLDRIEQIKLSGWIAPEGSFLRKYSHKNTIRYSINSVENILIGNKGELVKQFNLGSDITDERVQWAIAGVKRKLKIRELKFNCRDFSFLSEFPRYPVLSLPDWI